jgi:hypothetical protein
MNGGSVPGRGKRFSVFIIVQTGSVAHPSNPIQCIQGALAPGIKGPMREFDYSPPSSAEVNNGGAISPLPHTSSWGSG